jgi:F-type H+-transporting ATPase subunit gamma
MKMVASAKLRKAQYQIESFLPYETHLNEILNSFLASEIDFTSPLSEPRETGAVAIVVLSSNSSLCGAFNSNMMRFLEEVLAQYSHLSKDKIFIYPIGKKIEEHVRKSDWEAQGTYIDLMDKPNFDGAKDLADILVNDFLSKKIDKVELLYNHFKSTASQISTREQFLPLIFNHSTNEQKSSIQIDYIVEPDKETIISSLRPKALRAKIYAVLLDSAAAEQAARTVAMQIATDNAEELLDDLTVQYNKQRQQTITSELLDIVGGSEALK